MTTIIIGFVLLIFNALYLTIRYIVACAKVQQFIFTTNFIYVVIAAFLPILWWIYSTKEDAFNFYDRKKMTLRLVIVNSSMVVGQAIWTLVFNTLVLKICTIPAGRNFDMDMILNLCRISLVGITGLFILFVYVVADKIMKQEEVNLALEEFKWQHIVDTRKNKDTLFDLKILRDMKTGREVIIREMDRFVHMFILGNSGTGKTSSTLTPSIICDLNTKMRNMIRRQKKTVQMIRENKAYVAKPEQGDLISEWCVKAYDGYEMELDRIRKLYPDCGITVMAPNNSLNDDIIQLAKARGEMVNVIDPAKTYDDENVRMLGINPFFVQIGIDGDERQIQISNKAQTFAEVLMAVSEINGTGDQYFRDINTSVTTNIAIMCMLRANLHNRQTNIAEIQACINDFGKLKIIVDDIQSALHMRVVVHEVAQKNQQMKKDAGRVDRDMLETPEDPGTTEVDDFVFDEITDEAEVPDYYKRKGITAAEYSKMLYKQAQAYYEPIHFVLQELLGAGNEKMFDQARGLRNLINRLLLDPRIKNVLSASEKDFIDWDRALAHNEITVINTALEFSPQGSTTLGLFIMLNFKISVMRRPKNLRSNHYLSIDEASQYMHPMYEDMFALFRQYKVGVTLAMQSLSQMQKTNTTKYLEGVIMGSGIHIVFGRLNAQEMQYYESLSGMSKKEVTQTSMNTSSELDDNYSISKGVRQSTEDVSTLAGSDMRIRDFQEVSVFMIQGGRVLRGFIAKVRFPAKSEYKKKDVPHIDFSKYADYDVNELHPHSQANDKGREQTEQFMTNISNETVREEADGLSTLPVLPDIEVQRATIPDDINDITRKRKGIAEMLRDNAKDTSIFDITAQHALEVAQQRDEEEKDEEPPKADPVAAAYERRTKGYRNVKVERVDAVHTEQEKEQEKVTEKPKEKINFSAFGQQNFSDMFNSKNDRVIQKTARDGDSDILEDENLTEEELLERELMALNNERRVE